MLLSFRLYTIIAHRYIGYGERDDLYHPPHAILSDLGMFHLTPLHIILFLPVHATGGGPAPTSVQLPDGSCVVRRIIDSDNSCLFNAVGYVMDHSRALAQQLRQVIADRVAADPGGWEKDGEGVRQG